MELEGEVVAAKHKVERMAEDTTDLRVKHFEAKQALDDMAKASTEAAEAVASQLRANTEAHRPSWLSKVHDDERHGHRQSPDGRKHSRKRKPHRDHEHEHEHGHGHEHGRDEQGHDHDESHDHDRYDDHHHDHQLDDGHLRPPIGLDDLSDDSSTGR